VMDHTLDCDRHAELARPSAELQEKSNV